MDGRADAAGAAGPGGVRGEEEAWMDGLGEAQKGRIRSANAPTGRAVVAGTLKVGIPKRK